MASHHEREVIPLLKHEEQMLQEAIETLRMKKHILGGELGEAMSESAETWHDNAPQEAIVNEAQILFNRMLPFLKLLDTYVVVDYISPDQRESIGLGSKVVAGFDDGDEQTVFIVGHSGLYTPELLTAVEQYVHINAHNINEALFVSMAAPLGASLVGKNVGDQTSFAVNGHSSSLVILSHDEGFAQK